MGTITIRNLDDALKARLRLEAARRGHSMEEEVREILRRTFEHGQDTSGLGSRIHARFKSLGPDLAIPQRRSKPRAAKLPR